MRETLDRLRSWWGLQNGTGGGQLATTAWDKWIKGRVIEEFQTLHDNYSNRDNDQFKKKYAMFVIKAVRDLSVVHSHTTQAFIAKACAHHSDEMQ